MAEEKREDPKPSIWDHLADNYAYWMHRTLDDILTEYVRSKIRGPYHENIHYIHDLMAIEMYCIRGARHMAEGWHTIPCVRNIRKSIAQFSPSSDQM